MITVFGGSPTRAFRIVWALEELGLAFQLRHVNLRERQKDQELVKRNPAAFLPVLDDDGVVMVESIAILEYLIARYDSNKLAPPVDDPRYPLYQQFLHLGESGLAAYLNIVVASRFFAPESGAPELRHEDRRGHVPQSLDAGFAETFRRSHDGGRRILRR